MNTYWTYETSIGNNIAVSIRSSDKCDATQYYLFLAKFINTYGDRIYEINDPVRLFNGTYCCIIHLHNRTELKFPNFRS